MLSTFTLKLIVSVNSNKVLELDSLNVYNCKV